jgi:small subunit ribosomal protein S20
VANIKSAKKRIKVIAKKTAINKAKKSVIKTAEKRLLDAIAAGDKALATDKFKYAAKKIAQAGAASTVHKNAAARKISRLQKKLNSISAE